MKVVITQPNFLPWLGYFHQMISADIIIMLDNVQYLKREWQNRNRIIYRNGEIKYLTIPVQKVSQKTIIKEILISNMFKSCDIVNKIKSAYIGTEKSQEMVDTLQHFFDQQCRPNGINYLADINTKFIALILKKMNIEKEILFASDLECPDDVSATERLLYLCRKVGGTTYYSSIGARDYMKKDLVKFEKSGIDVQWQKFDHKNYVRCKVNQRFQTHLSVIDFGCHRDIKLLESYLRENGSFISEEVLP